MESATTIEQVRQSVAAARTAGKRIGFVPTMGALHAGHVSLIEAAIGRCGYVVVSIFVNPTQFGPGEDFDKYPRDLEADMSICKQAGVDLIFAPSASEMYQKENITWVSVDKLTLNLCGKFRPGHFRGVTTVCAKLFNIVQPDIAFFGQKDAQQALVIKRMVADLNMPLQIVVCPTVREPDGLAVSSRNKYLSAEERKDAVLLSAALAECEKLVAAGQRSCEALIEAMRKIISESSKAQIEYISIVDTETLADIDVIEGRALVALAVKIGSTRLIDNVIISYQPRSA
ncbi:MAG: pantoate--beta-alanine ligase [Planctomycetota bacterium]|mgnify:CR=1 FL=1|nr:MAG: pantoate--beta-alanine ligase [Planctomycetota bacterium]